MPNALKKSTPQQVLASALLNTGRALGLTQIEVGQVVGKDRTSLARGIDENSKAGELALLLIRCYRSLYVLMGGNDKDIKHWMKTPNLHTGGVPGEQILSVPGLIKVLEYLDAMRGKV